METTKYPTTEQRLLCDVGPTAVIAFPPPLLAFHFLLTHAASIITLKTATTALAAAGIEEGPYQWLPTTTRVTKVVYESLVGAFYPRLVRRTATGDWFFGSGARNAFRNEPHGFRFIYWYDAPKREGKRTKPGGRKQRVQETRAAILAANTAAHEMCVHIPVFQEGPALPQANY